MWPWSTIKALRAEVAAVATRRDTRAAFERTIAASVGIAVIDTDTLGFADFNDAAARGLGYTREQFAGLTLLDIDGQMSEPELWEWVDQVQRQGTLNVDTQHRCRDGALRDIFSFNRIIHRLRRGLICVAPARCCDHGLRLCQNLGRAAAGIASTAS